MNRALSDPIPQCEIKSKWFQNTYFLGGPALWTGLVQQTDQIVAAHDLSLFVGRHLEAPFNESDLWETPRIVSNDKPLVGFEPYGTAATGGFHGYVLSVGFRYVLVRGD